MTAIARFNSIPMLLGGALVFWGWHTGLWWLGLGLAFLAEWPRYLSGHWEFGVRERQRVADLSSLLLVLVGGYLYITQPRLGSAIILLVQWAPGLLFPLLSMQLYGGRSGVEQSVLFLSLRGGRPGGEAQMDLRPPYLLTCLLAAAMVPPPGTPYYLALSLIVTWILWHLRPQGPALWHWAGALILALSIGYGIGLGVQIIQGRLEDLMVEWLGDYFGEGSDPYRTMTAIGEIGRLKLSERILLRVWPVGPLSVRPLLLQSASFTRYIEGAWIADRSPFRPLTMDAQGWHLPGEQKAATGRIAVAMDLPRGRGLLPLPSGSRLLQGLEGAVLSRNATGALKVLEGPALAHYQVHYGAPSAAMMPTEGDLQVPQRERPALSLMVQHLGLRKLSATQALTRLRSTFVQDFRYTIQLEAPPAGYSALGYFLLKGHAGHCEYFASAAVLLLRAAGIPARYVQGFSVHEYSRLEHAYVARARHAHAWVLAWIDGAWQTFDPTPPDWGILEDDGRPWWSAVQDLWSWLRYRLADQNDQEQTSRIWLVAALIPLVLLLAWRIARRGRHTARARKTVDSTRRVFATLFTPIEQVLSAQSEARQPGETLRDWLDRLRSRGEGAADALIPALSLYYGQRFDPKGLDQGDTHRLQGLLDDWLRRYG